MRAAFIEKNGGPEEIRVGDLPIPEPGPGEVLVKVGASALNPIDLYLRSGAVPMPMAFPYVVGCDLAGRVEKLGPGSRGFKVGDRVWGSNQGMMGRQGTASEYAVVAEEWLYLTPDTLTDREAAAMALVGITAHLGLFQHGGLAAGKSLYIAGGSGGVGSMVIPMAKAVGARVATTAGSKEHLAVCRERGADMVINYKTDDLASRLREFSEDGVDLWYETQRAPDLELAIPLLKRRGRMIVMAGREAKPTLPLGSFYPRDCSLVGFAMFNATPAEQRMAAEEIIRWSGSGQISPLIGMSFPLEEAARAHEFLEANTLGGAGKLVGKVVLDVL